MINSINKQFLGLCSRSKPTTATVSNSVRRALYALSVGLLLLAGMTGCGFFRKTVIGPVVQPINEAVKVIDRGISAIEAESGAWRSTLQQVANDLPEEVAETIRQEAQQLATRTVAQGGQEIRCNVDFLADRAIMYLKRLKAQLLKQPVPPLPPPSFCQVVPDAISLSADPATWEKITLHGYDMDHTDKDGRLFKVILVNENGGLQELPESRIGRTHHYQVTLNMGGMASQLYEQRIVKVLVAWEETTAGRPEVVVIPWQPKTRAAVIPASVTTYTPPRTGGDGDFDTGDNDPMWVEVKGQINVQSRFIESQVFMYARESKGDHTRVEGWSPSTRAYTAPTNWKIIEVRPQELSEYKGNITSHGLHLYYTAGVISAFKVWGDQRGDEAGSYTKVEAHWRPLEIVLQEEAPTF